MNAKNKKILIILLFALVVSVIFAVGLYSYLSPQRTVVYVFNGKYAAGEEFTDDMVRKVQVDSKIISNGATEGIESVFITEDQYQDILRSGDVLRTDVVDGMPLTLSVFSVNGGSDVEMKMNNKSVAVTVPLTETTGVTNDLKQGSRVNVYTMRNDAVVLILQNMQILSVNRDDTGTMTSATIECNNNDALKLVYASSNSTIYLGMVSSSGYEPVTGTDPSYKPK